LIASICLMMIPPGDLVGRKAMASAPAALPPDVRNQSILESRRKREPAASFHLQDAAL
jgi:hypothetical protein